MSLNCSILAITTCILWVFFLEGPDGAPGVRLFTKVDMILQDGGAHKLVFGVEGDGGTGYAFCV